MVTCPAVPDLVTEGDTYEEAHEHAVEAIEGYLESLQKDGLPFPPDKKLSLDPMKEEIDVALPEPAVPVLGSHHFLNDPERPLPASPSRFTRPT